MSGMPLKTAVSDVYPNPDNATANAGFGALWTALNEATEKPELDIASAATIDLGGQLSTKLRITGTTGPITSFGTTYRGPIFGRFQSALAITHNATTLILPGGANLTTSAGGTFIAVPKATVSGTHDGWIVVYASDYFAKAGANSTITSLTGLTTGLAASRVKGLIGAPTTTTPLTKYDLSADEVVLRNSTGGTVTRYLTGTITNDLGLAGSAANGRDQAAAFTASSWIYLYFIWNGTTLATISSTAVPTTGPTLPTGYTHYSFATALRWNASSNIVAAFTNGQRVHYDLAGGISVGGGPTRVNGAAITSSTMASQSCTSQVPPIALAAKFLFSLSLSFTGIVAASFVGNVRRTGSTNFGQSVVAASVQVSGSTALAASVCEHPLSSQQIDCALSGNTPTTGGLYVDVLGYSVPNGDS